MEIHTHQVPVTVKKRQPGETTLTITEETRGWTTNSPHLVITPCGRSHVLTHAPSGCTIVNQGASMPDLYRLADSLARFDWSSPDLYETQPGDWGKRTEVVRTWYLSVFHDIESDSAAVTVRA